MRQFAAAVLERHTEYTDTFPTEPYETAWASEAIFFLRVEELTGEGAAVRADVQISADGIRWINEGTTFPAIIAPGDAFVRLKDFGGWLRLSGRVTGEDPRAKVTIHLVLKE